MNFKSTILSELDVLRKKELQDGHTFKGIAYAKVIQQIKQLDSVTSMEDLKDIKGIGESIREKIKEILETGRLEQAEEARKDPTLEIMDKFMNIYGIGRVKASNLVKKQNIKSIADLREAVKTNSKLLNKNQKVGLQYYEDLLERIPRAEMKKHEKLLKKNIKDLTIEIVGSYRRGEPSSGDIDVLIQWPSNLSAEDISTKFHTLVQQLKEIGYITDILAEGDKKCMAVCRLKDGTARRLDLLITPEEVYGFTLLYFTGSDKFNVALRKVALEKGYSLNEHGFTSMNPEKYPLPQLKSETDILNFLGYTYIDPKDRKNEATLQKFLK